MAFKLGLAVLCLLAATKADDGYTRDYPTNQLAYDQGYGYQEPKSLEEEWLAKAIPGVPGRDYPTFREVPQTRFECEQQQYPGYYADPEAGCQAFHICQDAGRKDSFLCPNGTLFNQETLVCEWWNKVDCSRAQNFYSVNEAIARAMQQAIGDTIERKKNEGYHYSANQDKNDYQSVKSEKYFQAEVVDRQAPSYGNDQRQSGNVAPTYGVPEISSRKDNQFHAGNVAQTYGSPSRPNNQPPSAVSAFGVPDVPPRKINQYQPGNVAPTYGSPSHSGNQNQAGNVALTYGAPEAQSNSNNQPRAHSVYGVPETPARQTQRYQSGNVAPAYGVPEVPSRSNSQQSGAHSVYGVPKVPSNDQESGPAHAVYGVPEVFSQKSTNAPTGALYDTPNFSLNALPSTKPYNSFFSQHKITGATFGKQTSQNIQAPKSIYLPA